MPTKLTWKHPLLLWLCVGVCYQIVFHHSLRLTHLAAWIHIALWPIFLLGSMSRILTDVVLLGMVGMMFALALRFRRSDKL